MLFPHFLSLFVGNETGSGYSYRTKRSCNHDNNGSRAISKESCARKPKDCEAARKKYNKVSHLSSVGGGKVLTFSCS
jgi:hypothetical protein